MEEDLSARDLERLPTFPLATPEGRQGFLWALAGAGEEGLIPATAHVWASLAAPRAIRCGLMATKVNVTGKAKAALYGVLKQFLIDMDREGDPPPLPLREAYETSAEWHAAVSAHFGAGDAAMQAVIDRYAAVLNGDAPETQPSEQHAVVLQGPWKQPRPRRGR